MDSNKCNYGDFEKISDIYLSIGKNLPISILTENISQRIDLIKQIQEFLFLVKDYNYSKDKNRNVIKLDLKNEWK